MGLFSKSKKINDFFIDKTKDIDKKKTGKYFIAKKNKNGITYTIEKIYNTDELLNTFLKRFNPDDNFIKYDDFDDFDENHTKNNYMKYATKKYIGKYFIEKKKR